MNNYFLSNIRHWEYLYSIRILTKLDEYVVHKIPSKNCLPVHPSKSERFRMYKDW